MIGESIGFDGDGDGGGDRGECAGEWSEYACVSCEDSVSDCTEFCDSSNNFIDFSDSDIILLVAGVEAKEREKIGNAWKFKNDI